MIFPWKTWRRCGLICLRWIPRKESSGSWTEAFLRSTVLSEFGETKRNEQTKYSRGRNRYSRPGSGGRGTLRRPPRGRRGQEDKNSPGDQGDHRQGRVFAHGAGGL